MGFHDCMAINVVLFSLLILVVFSSFIHLSFLFQSPRVERLNGLNAWGAYPEITQPTAEVIELVSVRWNLATTNFTDLSKLSVSDDNKQPKSTEKKFNFLVSISHYNTTDRLIACLASVKNQTSDNYRVCVVDDGSPDTDGLETVAQMFGGDSRYTFMRYPDRRGKAETSLLSYNCLKPQDEDVFILLDGDDRLEHGNVFKVLNRIYTGSEEPWVTFGSFRAANNTQSFTCCDCKPSYLRGHIRRKDYRKTWWTFSHLKTFKQHLLKRVPKQDLIKDGKYLTSAVDLAIMYPILEMAGKHVRCIAEILYVYTEQSSLSHHNNRHLSKIQEENAKYVRALGRFKSLDSKTDITVRYPPVRRKPTRNS
eukprot:Platyproteum_vivax@DN4461_c0_g1_i1.p1